MVLHVITVATREHPGLALWRGTAEAAGVVPTVLGLGDARPLGHDAQGRFGLKFVLVSEFCRSVPPSDLVMFTDGYDVVFLDGPEVLEAKARALGAEHTVVFSAERFENPDQGMPYAPSSFAGPMRYLNSGGYVGTAASILALLARFSSLSPAEQLDLDDQRYYTQAYFADPSRVVLDTASHLFACMAGASAHVVGRRVVMRHSGAKPSVLHFQGYEKNVVPFVVPLFPQYEPLARLIHNVPHKPAWKSGIEALGTIVPKRGHPITKIAFFRGLLWILVLLATALAVWFTTKRNL